MFFKRLEGHGGHLSAGTLPGFYSFLSLYAVGNYVIFFSRLDLTIFGISVLMVAAFVFCEAFQSSWCLPSFLGGISVFLVSAFVFGRHFRLPGGCFRFSWGISVVLVPAFVFVRHFSLPGGCFRFCEAFQFSWWLLSSVQQCVSVAMCLCGNVSV